MVVGDIQEGIDVAVIGAGPGGYVAAIRAAQLGRKVTLIDSRERLGGVCLHEGCIPSKALIHAANVYHGLSEAEEFGVRVEGRSIDVVQMQQWKRGIISKLSKGIGQLCKENHVTFLRGTARFTSPNSLQVDSENETKSYQFKHAIIASGSEAIQIPSLPFDAKKNVVGSKGALNLESIPKKLAVIGAGYIGVELGTVYAKLGSQVTFIEVLDGILPGLDRDITKVIERRLKGLGVTVLTGTEVTGFDKGGLQTKGNGSVVEADQVIVAVGRRPKSDSLNLQQVRVKTDEKGFIVVDQRQQTSQPTIYAIGDVVGEPLLAHKASAEGKVAAEAICGKQAAFDAVVPSVIFSDPEIASVGMTTEEAKEAGIETIVSQFSFAALGKSLAAHAPAGFVKILAAADTKRVLGIHMVGAAASELIAEATMAIEMGAFADDLALTVHTHPTFSEAIAEAAEMLYGEAIHISPRKQKTR